MLFSESYIIVARFIVSVHFFCRDISLIAASVTVKSPFFLVLTSGSGMILLQQDNDGNSMILVLSCEILIPPLFVRCSVNGRQATFCWPALIKIKKNNFLKDLCLKNPQPWHNSVRGQIHRRQTSMISISSGRICNLSWLSPNLIWRGLRIDERCINKKGSLGFYCFCQINCRWWVLKLRHFVTFAPSFQHINTRALHCLWNSDMILTKEAGGPVGTICGFPTWLHMQSESVFQMCTSGSFDWHNQYNSEKKQFYPSSFWIRSTSLRMLQNPLVQNCLVLAAPFLFLPLNFLWPLDQHPLSKQMAWNFWRTF